MKNNLERHVDYYSHNPQGYWFRSRLYGWGWTPVRWQGWLVTALAIGIIIALGVRVEVLGMTSDRQWLELLVPVVIVVIALITICYRTGESPHWQWGPLVEKDEKGK